MRCDGPSVQECVGGPTAETDLGVISPSEVVIDVREVQQGDYVRVTLRFEKTKRNIAADKILRNVMCTDVLRSSKKFLGFLLLAYGRNESETLISSFICQHKNVLFVFLISFDLKQMLHLGAPLGSWYIPHQETTVPPKAR